MGLPATVAIMDTVAIMVINNSTSVTLNPRVDGFTQMEWIRIWVMIWRRKGRFDQHRLVRNGIEALASLAGTIRNYKKDFLFYWMCVRLRGGEETGLSDNDKSLFKYVEL